MFPILFLLYLSLSIVALPLNSTDPNSDISPLVSPADDPNVFQQRSIWDILWSCLATIFVCSWVSVHPNIPPVEGRWWKVSLRRLGLMMWSILAPSMTILWAARQWIAAKKLEEYYKKKHPALNWTRTHSYFIQMGGFVLYDDQRSTSVVLDPDRMDALIKKGLKLPFITEEEIKDRRRGDGLSKALVVCQTIWFVIQCMVRRAENLPITPLELVTASLACLNGTMYFLWWKKPLGVRYPVSIHANCPITEKDVQLLTTTSLQCKETPNDQLVYIRRPISQNTIFAPLYLRFKQMLEEHRPGSAFYASTGFKDENSASIFTDFIGLIFGAIHCAGWGFMFLSSAELILWRASSAILIGIALCMFFVSLSVRGVAKQSSPKLTTAKQFLAFFIRILLGFLIPVYIVSRFVLIMVAFTTLRHLQQGAYEEISWLSFFPHI